MRYDDVEVGETRTAGSYTVTQEEIVEFARQYDPQPFHVDPEAAADSMFGTLIASGWHTGAITMRLLVTEIFGPEGSMGSPGMESLRWPNPLLPGETVEIEITVNDKRPLESTAGMGLVETSTTTRTDDGKVVMEMESTVFVARDEDDES